MQLRHLNKEILFAVDPVRSLSQTQIEYLRQEALASPTGRLRICLHRDPEDSLHEMCIALCQDVYYPPHRHVLTEESYVVLDGLARFYVYTEAGELTDEIELGDAASGLQFYARIPANVYHCLLIESDVCVFLETKLGPFSGQPNITAPFPGPVRNNASA